MAAAARTRRLLPAWRGIRNSFYLVECEKTSHPSGTAGHCERTRALVLLSALLIVEENVEDKQQTRRRSQQEKDHRQARIAKDAKRCFDSHQHRRTDNQRRYHQTQRNSVVDFLKSFENDFLVDRVNFETQIVVSRGVEDSVDARGQLLDEFLQINHAR